MPQQKNPFSTFVATFKEYVEIDNPALKVCNCDSYANIHDKVAALTKQDLYIIANNRISASLVSSLNDIKEFALKTTTNPATGKPEFTANAKFAIAALNALKPSNVKLADYLQMIEEVAENTKTFRAQVDAEIQKKQQQKKTAPSTSTKAPLKKLGAAVFNDDHGIMIDPTDHKGFDQQTALAILGERGVKVDVDQSHKTPNFEQEALKAVASLKNTVITRAA